MFTMTTVAANQSRTTNNHICIEVKGLGNTTRHHIPRRSVWALRDVVAKYLNKHGFLPSIREFAQWACGGCPCNLAEELGFSNSGQLYTMMRFWDNDCFVRTGLSRMPHTDGKGKPIFVRDAMKGTSAGRRSS